MSENQSGESFRLLGILIVVLLGLLLSGILAYSIPVKDGWKASDVTTLVSSLTTFIGTIVGAFFGAQIGAAGKQKAESLARRALAALPPEDGYRVLQQEYASSKVHECDLDK